MGGGRWVVGLAETKANSVQLSLAWALQYLRILYLYLHATKYLKLVKTVTVIIGLISVQLKFDLPSGTELSNLWVLNLVLDSPFCLVKLCPHTKFQLPRRCISDLTLFPPPSETDRVKKFRGSKTGSGLTFFVWWNYAHIPNINFLEGVQVI